MYSRRVVVAVLVGLLVLVFLIGDASADNRRKEVLPSYMKVEWGDPDSPAGSKQYTGQTATSLGDAESGLWSAGTVWVKHTSPLGPERPLGESNGAHLSRCELRVSGLGICIRR